MATAVSLQAQTLNDSLKLYNNAANISGKDKHKIIKPVSIAAGYAGFCLFSYRYLDDEVQEIAQANQSKIAYNAFKTVGYIGRGTSSVAITAAASLTALVTKNKRFEKAAVLLVGAHLVNDFATHQFKVSFQRHRPSTGDPYNTFDWREGNKTNLSFISSHTSNAFTTATVFALCFSDKKWVPIVAYTTASIVGLSRIYQNAHWTSDVLCGAAIGYLSAQGINILYNIAGKKFTFLPEVDNGHFDVSVSYALK